MSDSLFDTAVSEAALSAGGAALTPEETDTLGEVGNICMGAAATTMYTLMDRRVEITTPRVSVHTIRDVLATYSIPFVIVDVEYTEGITGDNLLLLKEYDAAVITDVLMGGEGAIEEPIEFNELHMSAMNEIMNQMVGASATALSKVIGRMVNIAPPVSKQRTLESEEDGMLTKDEVVIVIVFDMEIEGLLKSQLIQFMPYEQGREISAMLIEQNKAKQPPVQPQKAEPLPEPQPEPAPEPAVAAAPPDAAKAHAAHPHPHMHEHEHERKAGFEQRHRPQPGDLIDVRRMIFEPFDGVPGKGRRERRDDVKIINNIPLSVSAELGVARRNLSDVLDFEVGTVIMLDKIAGDPVEVLVNGKLVASGEVVVIDENYGVRITQMPRA
ncbi:MAG: flagellar motor switch phosphatase FliY [Oscillospiraceae bacterium]|nr:flagellar motor switch phosphatase FliY [Oscillospiraceae bacterium]